ncbi:T9SS type A sorting domain-containing protein [candidate division KSB1 bacterium]|nr:T9SS type A sorting domain-containing protein [candidate division KSB1 bacterium]NIR72947.1 T9SS type A sorting domain-containing protein [candidate division KSB1 bacterium]NIS28246.1 T9SS type A sorting domain-containing protein [candidate division KSB1 bacterium]NIT75135.1 T9SS type A sorting domain-containing protein [candidate division KSB1 bacterium]NIU28923.1 T9SS type A sorting domain-containing protein [candidate division KSB1 bacterium]
MIHANSRKHRNAFLSFYPILWLLTLSHPEAHSQSLSFTEVTASAGISVESLGTHGGAVADFDNDGDPDIYVCSQEDFKLNNNDYKGNYFFRNDGDGTFTRIDDDTDLQDIPSYAHAAIFFDMDHDGDFDLAVGHGLDGLSRRGLWRNDGNEVFVRVDDVAGFENTDDIGTRSIVAGDMNGDGWIDIHFASFDGFDTEYYWGDGTGDFTRQTGLNDNDRSIQGSTMADLDLDGDLDVLFGNFESQDGVGYYKNDGTGTFTRVLDTGLPDTGSGTAVNLADIDRDGDLDVLVCGESGGVTNLYRNTNDSFTIIQDFPAASVCVKSCGRNNGAFGDYDNDGDLDLFLPFSSTKIWLNDGIGSFTAMDDSDSGVRYQVRDARFPMLLDYDSDGDLDLFLAQHDGSAKLFRNNINSNASVRIALVGPKGDKGGFGTKVWVYEADHLGEPGHLLSYQEAMVSAGYCIQHEPKLHFGLGDRTAVDVYAEFMNGKVMALTGLSPGQIITIDGSTSQLAPAIVINEIVTDPQQDWNDSEAGNDTPFDNVPGSGTGTDTDEWLELYNADSEAVNLEQGDGWTLELLDTTPEILNFANPGNTEFVFSNGGDLSHFQPGEYLVIGNPPGEINNDIFIVFKNELGAIVDDVEIGDDPEEDGKGDGAADGRPAGGNATGLADEAIARHPNAPDSDNDVADFVQQAATIGALNTSQACVTYVFDIEGGTWYLISLPVVPDDNRLSTLFPTATGAFSWDFDSQSYISATTLQPERAYWLLYLTTATEEVCGEPVESYSNDYNEQGWDMIGSVIDTSSVVDAPDNSIVSMFSWNSISRTYEAINPLETTPTQGYWILVLGTPSTVTVGGGASPSNLTKLAADADLVAFYKEFGQFPPSPPFNIEGKTTESLPENYRLFQNYPNPFNPETVIEYQLPHDGKVTLEIFSILGQKVRTLVDENKSAGYYRLIWDGTNDAGQRLASGVYLYRIQVGHPSTGAGPRFVQTRKFLKLK